MVQSFRSHVLNIISIDRKSKDIRLNASSYFILIITKLIGGNEIGEERHGFEKELTADNDFQHLLEKASVNKE